MGSSLTYRALSTTQPRCSRASIERWKTPRKWGPLTRGRLARLAGWATSALDD